MDEICRFNDLKEIIEVESYMVCREAVFALWVGCRGFDSGLCHAKNVIKMAPGASLLSVSTYCKAMSGFSPILNLPKI